MKTRPRPPRLAPCLAESGVWVPALATLGREGPAPRWEGREIWAGTAASNPFSNSPFLPLAARNRGLHFAQLVRVGGRLTGGPGVVSWVWGWLGGFIR